VRACVRACTRAPWCGGRRSIPAHHGYPRARACAACAAAAWAQEHRQQQFQAELKRLTRRLDFGVSWLPSPPPTHTHTHTHHSRVACAPLG
jgi:hypothetical protein